MTHCDDLISELQQQAREQIQLAVVAEAPPVAAMHIDLALFSVEQVRIADQLCDES